MRGVSGLGRHVGSAQSTLVPTAEWGHERNHAACVRAGQTVLGNEEVWVNWVQVLLE